ncbi:MAG: hypothetical protein LBK82_12915 [Planctomycetaceae bacterium]|nr:hypothetical protein [Planctomycetaceae bacterium]
MGNLSLKGCVGVLADSESDLGIRLLTGNRVQVGYHRRDLSAKGHPPMIAYELTYSVLHFVCTGLSTLKSYGLKIIE